MGKQDPLKLNSSTVTPQSNWDGELIHVHNLHMWLVASVPTDMVVDLVQTLVQNTRYDWLIVSRPQYIYLITLSRGNFGMQGFKAMVEYCQFTSFDFICNHASVVLPISFNKGNKHHQWDYSLTCRYTNRLWDYLIACTSLIPNG